jgi:hypothetical protein
LDKNFFLEKSIIVEYKYTLFSTIYNVFWLAPKQKTFFFVYFFVLKKSFLSLSFYDIAKHIIIISIYMWIFYITGVFYLQWLFIFLICKTLKNTGIEDLLYNLYINIEKKFIQRNDVYDTMCIRVFNGTIKTNFFGKTFLSGFIGSIKSDNYSCYFVKHNNGFSYKHISTEIVNNVDVCVTLTHGKLIPPIINSGFLYKDNTNVVLSSNKNNELCYYNFSEKEKCFLKLHKLHTIEKIINSNFDCLSTNFIYKNGSDEQSIKEEFFKLENSTDFKFYKELIRGCVYKEYIFQKSNEFILNKNTKNLVQHYLENYKDNI